MSRTLWLLSVAWFLAASSCGQKEFPNFVCVSPNPRVNPSTGLCEDYPPCPPTGWQPCVDAGAP